ncbi:MAG: ComEC/Rec2 family competence protein [Bacteroidia bacterium]
MKQISHAPLFRIALVFVLGLLASFEGFPSHWASLAICIALGLQFVPKAYTKSRLILIGNLSWYLTALGCGGLLVLAQPVQDMTQPDLYTYMCAERHMIAIPDGPVKKSRFGKQVDAQVIAVWDDSLWQSVSGRIRLRFSLEDTSEVAPWDSIQVYAYVRDLWVKNKGYQEYLNKQNLKHVAYVKRFQKQGKYATIQAESWRVQNQLSSRVQKLVSGEKEKAIACAMLLGDKRLLTSETKKAFSVSGLSHILAISGLHVGIIFLILNALVKPLKRFKNGNAAGQLIVMMILIGYMLIAGAAPAVCRSVMMFGLMTLVRMFGKRVSILNVLGASALIQLMINPELVLSLGFQLSYLAVAGIVLLMPFFEKYTKTHNYFLDMFFGWMAVSISATIFTAPLIILHFGVFPAHFILANVAVSLVVFFAVMAGFLTVLTAYIPCIGEVMGMFSSKVLMVLQWIVEWTAQLPGAQISSLNDEGVLWLVLELAVAGILMLSPKIWAVLKDRPIMEIVSAKATRSYL